jgi:trehalose 6-phosphate phosphatase
VREREPTTDRTDTSDRSAGPSDSGVSAGQAFEAARQRALELVDARSPILVVTDFDGTLSPIVQDPLGAVIEPLARTALRRLARLAETHTDRLSVVVLSGRTSVDVAGRVRVGGVRYLGNHGLESGILARRRRAEGLTVRADETLQPYVPSTALVASTVADGLGNPPWLFVELKGPSVAFHFRQAPDVDRAREQVLGAIDAAEEDLGEQALAMTRLEGRRIIELRPTGAGGKGAAVERLIERNHPGAIVMLGDDVSDAEGFEVIVRERRRGTLAGLAVAVHGARETPPQVRAAADVELATTHDAARLLSALAGALTRSFNRSSGHEPI